jgi:hypothetical protein
LRRCFHRSTFYFCSRWLINGLLSLAAVLKIPEISSKVQPKDPVFKEL